MSINYNSQNLRIFISYARGDTEAANRLYNDLKMSGLDPWLDIESLLVGENWRIAIKEAIRNSRYFIPLLSTNSVEKIGYVQSELKEALEILQEFPQSKRFIIPVRLDNCNINDEKLSEIHVVDLFPDWKQGIQKILKSMGMEPNNKLEDGDQQNSLYHYEDWNELLRYIYEKKCSPFIGPEARIRWIPSDRNIAIIWAEEYGYTLPDRFELPQVAQYMAIIKNDNAYPKKYYRRILQKISPPDFSISEYENTVYAVLADLNLPIYITTNYDHLMEKALTDKGKEPKSEFFRWNKTIIDYTKRADIKFVSDDPMYAPSPANPLVFHLHGDMDHPISMVLTEQDYFDFIFNLGNLVENPIMLPAIMRRTFATSAQIFIGFTLNDINSRILFRNIMSLLSAVEPLYSVTIMSSPMADPLGKNIDQAKKYLDTYTKNMFNMNIYWSDPFMFSINLRNSFNKFRETASSKGGLL